MKITAKILEDKNACPSQLHKFRKLFPDGVEVTAAVCISVADEFDWDWAANNLLPPSFLADYEAKEVSLWKDYDAKVASPRADYNAKVAPLWADYNAKVAPLWADYNAKKAPLLADYEAKEAPLLADYCAKVAELFGSLVELI